MCSTKAMPLLLLPLAFAAPYAFAPAAVAGGFGAVGEIGAVGLAQGGGLGSILGGIFTSSNMGWASLALKALGVGADIYGQKQQADSTRAQEEYNTALARNNQITQQRLAQDALDRGQVDAKGHRKDIAHLIGTQRAALAGQGVVVDQDTAADITVDTAAVGEQEARIIEANAEREAYGYRTQAANYGGAAQLALLRSRQRPSILTTALSGGASVLGQYAVLEKNKVI